MNEWIEVNGAKIKKDFFEENLAEARSYKWEKSPHPKDLDHSHCLICDAAIPELDNVERTAYKSKFGWLCNYCYKTFIVSLKENS